MTLALARALAGLALAAASSLGGMGTKPYGVILLGEGGSAEWKQTAADAAKQLGPDRPLVFAEGQADARDIQRAVDELQSKRVEKIVAVPLFVTTYSDVMDQTRYVFGIRESPLEGQSPRRVHSKVPMILAKALDDSPLAVEILASRALVLARKPAQEAVVLIGEAPAEPEAASQWVATVSALAQKVAAKAGMRGGQAMALREDLMSDQRQKAEKQIVDALKALRKQGPVSIVPLELAPGDVQHRLRKLLEGQLVHYNGKSILPDARISKWIEQTAETASKLPDMRQFKSELPPKSKGLKPPPIKNQPFTKRGADK
jgi:sirohydrochlorin cobaltochelatase